MSYKFVKETEFDNYMKNYVSKDYIKKIIIELEQELKQPEKYWKSNKIKAQIDVLNELIGEE